MRLYPPFLLLFGIIITIVLGCSEENRIYEPPPLKTFDDAIHLSVPMLEIDDNHLPNVGYSLETVHTLIPPYDADSIEMYEYRGGVYYHPVKMSHRILNFINSYNATQDSTLLFRAEKYAAKLLELGLFEDSAAYLPYYFRFAVHADSANTMAAPWFSGMAQGEFLSILCRLYKITGKEKYLDYAGFIFKSFLRLKDENDKWIVRVDQDNYFWIEEYPHQYHPGRTLNGFITAVYGIYEYARLTDGDEPKYIYELSLTTLKHYLPQYRRAGTTSYYCLEHLHPADSGYHDLHISMLGYLYQFSGDMFFLEMQTFFEADF